MKIVTMPYGIRPSVARPAGGDDCDRIDYTSPPEPPRRRRRRPEEDIGTASTIFPKAATVPRFVSDRNPYGTEYVKQLVERIDSGKFPHELDERRKKASVVDDEVNAGLVREAS